MEKSQVREIVNDTTQACTEILKILEINTDQIAPDLIAKLHASQISLQIMTLSVLTAMLEKLYASEEDWPVQTDSRPEDGNYN